MDERKTDSNMIPLKFQLSQNYPNPFKDKTSIKYCIAFRTHVNITIFNPNGHMIKTLVNTEQDAGTYEITCSAGGFNEGEYVYKMTAGDYSGTKSMLVRF